MTGAQVLGPAVGSFAAFFDSAGMQQSYYVSGLPKGFASAWLKGAGNAMPYARFVVDPDADKNWDNPVDVTETGWGRYGVADGSGYFRLETRGDTDGSPLAITEPSSVTAYGAQLEPGMNYPSSYIPTQNGERTREADKLYVNSANAAAVAPGGFFHVKLAFAPNYATGENKAAGHDLLWFDSANRVYLRFSDNKIVLRIDGKEIASAPLAWAREDKITVEAVHSPSGRRLTVSGADVTGAPSVAIPSLTVIHVLGDNNGAQECADLRYIGFFPPN
jgi:hypothetical protein